MSEETKKKTSTKKEQVEKKTSVENSNTKIVDNVADKKVQKKSSVSKAEKPSDKNEKIVVVDNTEVVKKATTTKKTSVEKKSKSNTASSWEAHAVGKRKACSARVFISKSNKHQVVVNSVDFVKFFGTGVTFAKKLVLPFETCGLKIDDFSIKITSVGGGKTGVIDSIVLGISRCLLKIVDDEKVALLKKSGLLTRDSRVVESKKYGLRKARKKEQFSKR